VVAQVEVSEPVRRKAVALGDDGRRWLDELPSTLRALERAWGVAIGASFGGGSVAYVAAASADFGAAVVKVSMPDGLEGNGEWARELASVQVGQGHGYVGLFGVDIERRAMLLEHLGAPIADLGLSIEEQIDGIATTSKLGWQRPADPSIWRTGAEQAAFLDRCIDEWWRALGRPCPARVIETARECVGRRHDAFDPASSVLIHGDAHLRNVLAHPRGGFRLIDPDGMLSEPAHDLAIPLRHWNGELLVDRDPAARVRSWCARLEQSTVAEAQATWEWALAERVSTGLFLLRLGDASGQGYLDVATRLVA
jgi:streptomycin 6-kinase